MQACLVCLDATKVPDAFALREGVFVIGRSSASEIVVRDATVSRHHARLVVNKVGIRVADLGSLNGTFIDGTQVGTERAIVPGQTLRCGSVSFRLNNGRVGEGGLALDSDVGTEPKEDKGETKATAVALSGAQVEVLMQLMRGYREKEIAARLIVSPHTVHTHVKAIFRRFGVHSRSELLAVFLDGWPNCGKG